MTQPPPPRLVRAAVIAMASVFGLTYSLTASVIALDLAARGVSDTVIGANAAMHALGILLLAPFLAALAARFGGRRLVLAALALNAAILVALPLSPAIWTWFPLRIGLGIAAEILFVMSETWTTQFSSPADRGRSMAVYMTAMSLGLAAGPIITSLIGSAGPLPWAIGVATVAATAALACVPGLPPLATGDAPPRSPARILRIAPLGMASATLNAGLEAAGLSFLPLYAMHAGWTETGATRLIATLMVGAIALQLPIGWLADRMDRRRLAIGLATAAGLGALAWPAILGIPWLAYTVLFVWGGLLVGIYTTFLAILGDRFQGSELVGVYTVMGLAWGVGALVGPLLVGAAAALTPHALPFAAGAACLAFAALAARQRTAA